MWTGFRQKLLRPWRLNSLMSCWCSLGAWDLLFLLWAREMKSRRQGMVLGDEEKPSHSCINYTIWGETLRASAQRSKARAAEPEMTDRFSSPISLLSQDSLLFTVLSETNSKQFVSSGLKQEVGFLSQEVTRLIYLQFNMELWSCNDQICLILSSCRLWDSRVLIERFSKPPGVRKAQRILMKCWNVAHQIRYIHWRL